MMSEFDPLAAMAEMETNPSIEAADIYGDVLSRCPVSRTHINNAQVEWWGAYGYDELLSVLKNFRAMSSTVGVDERGLPTIIPLFADPPLHTGFRKLLNPSFPPAVVGRIEGDIRVFANEMIDDMVAKRDVDFHEEFGSKFPTRVLCRFLGVPDEDWPIHYKFVSDNDRLSTAFTNPAAGMAKSILAEFVPYVRKIIAFRRENPADNIINSFVTGDVEGRKLEEHEIIHLVIAMMLAGHATTTAAISNFTLRLASDQALQATLRANPNRIPDALEESLRMDAPQQALLRKCLVDTDVGGQTIKAGQFVLTNYGSANNDPRKFDHPETFDLDRAGKGHLSFGFGMHQCLGQHLARLDMRIAIETLLDKTSSITVNGPVKRRTYPVLAPLELPLRLEPA
ncbi:cytochrome P450 [Sphingobium estronivorans]|uniref:cytochrome P450 n=1 Tax=Sphingobium estronivorans TaxID=1577690 RepID=UPI0012398B0A|nr:cytochrome P450 [Sphingobium estronivorans]